MGPCGLGRTFLLVVVVVIMMMMVVHVVVVLAGSLKPLDIAFLRAIHQKVNIVPVIAKADTLTKTELARLKNTVCMSH